MLFIRYSYSFSDATKTSLPPTLLLALQHHLRRATQICKDGLAIQIQCWRAARRRHQDAGGRRVQLPVNAGRMEGVALAHSPQCAAQPLKVLRLLSKRRPLSVVVKGLDQLVKSAASSCGGEKPSPLLVSPSPLSPLLRCVVQHLIQLCQSLDCSGLLVVHRRQLLRLFR